MASRPLFYDTETTGVRSEVDRIIEIAVYDPELDRSFVSFVKPDIPIPPDASAVHGITDEMVADADDWGVVGQKLIEFCSGDVMLVAHNNDNFDIKFLQAEFKRFDTEMPQWKFFDTLKWARRYRKDLPRHSLQFLREIYGFPPNNAHRALDDVIILYKVYCALVDDLPADTVWDLIYSQSQINAESSVTRMPFGKHQGKALKDVPKSYVRWLHQDGALDKPENQALREGFEQAGLLSA